MPDPRYKQIKVKMTLSENLKSIADKLAGERNLDKVSMSDVISELLKDYRKGKK